MTSSSLLLWIAFGIALQVAIWLGIEFWRHWLEYQGLRSGVPVQAGAVLSAAPQFGALSEPASIAAWSGLRPFRVERRVVEDGAETICSFYLIPEDGEALPSFLPGQFLTFRLDVSTAAGLSEQIVRCYSLSDAPRPDYYRVSIKRVLAPPGCDVPPGRSSNHFHDQVTVGSVLQVRAPSGHFHIDRSDDPVVLIGGGIGITPMLSMVNWCLSEQSGREVWLFYGVRNSREVIMRGQLEALAAAHQNFHLRMCFSDPLPEDVAVRDYQHPVRVDLNVLRMQLPLKPYHYYICGPAPMMESLVSELEDWGVPDSRIHFEAFGPATVKKAAVPLTPHETDALSKVEITFSRAGKKLRWNPAVTSLLELAEANGIKIEAGCRAGNCGTCLVAIKSGEVNYMAGQGGGVEAGSCLTCVCKPKSNLVLDA